MFMYESHCSLAYLDDICISSSTLKQYKEVVRRIFQKLRDNNLTINTFAKTEIIFLVHVIGSEGIRISEKKAIKNFDKPEIAKNF